MVENIKQIFQITNKVNPENIGLYIIYKVRKDFNKDKWKIFRIKINENVSSSLLNIVNEFLKTITEQKSLDVINYHPGPNTDKSIVSKLPLSKFDDFNNLLNILHSSLKSIPDDGKVKYYDPKAFIFKLDTFSNGKNNNSIFLFQYLQNQKTLKKRILIGKFDDKFVKIDNELFYINNTFDLMFWDNKNENSKKQNEILYIFNERRFDWLFGFLDEFKDEIEDKFNQMNDIKQMIDVEKFVEFVKNDYIFLRKTYNVLNNGNFNKYFNEETIKIIEKEVPITKLKRKNGKIIINEENVKKILNIVNEDYLKSIVSETVYKSLSKTDI